ncbi:BgTH12-00185 [Blumeria graminis f. sp. triticale]|uniref:Bgt-3577 n=3 Tax=Blumeria graminis TaxID=34373 RepID=A0A061HIZ0_BLUGR|nr:hypothetical protein BGT96224_3577 [Blumeria graminis f. sp. tritici 96224]CAD6504679.1 BgTH12-00185 [Blumeria graminis f. sp. triticale]VDB92717.1 Bgt-3577 [Blumeria graminis f. sp. tritici]
MAILPIVPLTPQHSGLSYLHPIEPDYISSLDQTIPDISDVLLEQAAASVESHAKFLKAKKNDTLKHEYQSRRDLFVKGHEGSRRRKRYDNANFLNVPNYQPPLPSDWEVHPTHTVHQNVPYYLANLWDSRSHCLPEQRKKIKSGSIRPKVPNNVKLALKKAKGARPLLQGIENQIRNFIQQSIEDNNKQNNRNEILVDSEDEEIVFIGRDSDGRGVIMSDEPKLPTKISKDSESLIFKSDEGSSGFVRWLVHELAEYYGLNSRSEGSSYATNHGMSERKVIVVLKKGHWEGDQRTRLDDLNANHNVSNSKYDLAKMPPPLWSLI